MAIDDLYRWEWRGANRIRYRADIMIASATTMPGSPTVHAIPHGVLTVSPPSASEYPDGIPIGEQKTGVWPVKINLGRLRGTTALEYLRTKLEAYLIPSGGEVPGYTGVGDSFDLANVWRIYSDDGTGGSSWRMIFEGVQSVDPSPKIEIQIGRGLTMEANLVHISTAVLQAARMQAIMVRTRLGGGGVEMGYLIDLTWSGEGHTYIVDTNGYYAQLWPWANFWLQVNRLLDDVYCIMTRRTPDNDELSTYHWRILSIAGVYGSTPLDHWVLFEQDEETVGDVGPAVAMESRYMVGTFSVLPGGSLTAGPLLAGLGKGGVASYESVGAFIAAQAKAGGVRVVYQQIATGEMDMLLVPALADQTLNGNWTATSVLDLSPSDFRMQAGERKITGIMSDKLIRAVNVPIRGAQGDDRKTQKSSIDESQSWGVGIDFDNLPIVGEKDWFKYKAEEGVTLRASIERLFVWKLYYMGTAAGRDGTQAIRIHSSVQVKWDGTTGIAHGFPLDTLPTSPDDEDDFGNFVDWFRDTAVAVQQTDGIGGALCQQLPAFFSDRRQTSYQITVPLVLSSGRPLDQSIVGCVVRLPVDGSGNRTANGLISATSTYADLYTWCVVTSAKPDHTKGTIELELLGVKQ